MMDILVVRTFTVCQLMTNENYLGSTKAEQVRTDQMANAFLPIVEQDGKPAFHVSVVTNTQVIKTSTPPDTESVKHGNDESSDKTPGETHNDLWPPEGREDEVDCRSS